jgi:hypothetical protein
VEGTAAVKPTPLPIACTLDGPALGERLERWRRLEQRALRAREPLPNGVRLRFENGPEVAAELGELVRLERECCGFAAWEVSADGDDAVLDVTAEGQGADAVREMFGPLSAAAPAG